MSTWDPSAQILAFMLLGAGIVLVSVFVGMLVGKFISAGKGADRVDHERAAEYWAAVHGSDPPTRYDVLVLDGAVYHWSISSDSWVRLDTVPSR